VRQAGGGGRFASSECATKAMALGGGIAGRQIPRVRKRRCLGEEAFTDNQQPHRPRPNPTPGLLLDSTGRLRTEDTRATIVRSRPSRALGPHTMSSLLRELTVVFALNEVDLWAGERCRPRRQPTDLDRPDTERQWLARASTATSLEALRYNDGSDSAGRCLGLDATRSLGRRTLHARAGPEGAPSAAALRAWPWFPSHNGEHGVRGASRNWIVLATSPT